MTNLKRFSAFILVLLLIASSLSACSGTSGGDTATTATTANYSDETPSKNYYTKEDFNSIVLNESTFQDAYSIAPSESMCVTSYGGFCDYPMENGGYIRIKFVGENLVVGDIEIISSSQ